MKKRFKIFKTLALLLFCCGCTNNNNLSSVNSDIENDNKQAPVFTGLTKENEQINTSSEFSNKIKDSSSIEDDSNQAYVGEPIYLTAHFSNPNSFEILSFSINETKFSSYMFLPGSNMTEITVEVPGNTEAGDFTYVISQIKYVDGTKIKDVKMNGNDKYVVHFIDPEEEKLNELNIYCASRNFYEYLQNEINDLLKIIETDVTVNVILKGGYESLESEIIHDSINGLLTCGIYVGYFDFIEKYSNDLFEVTDLLKLCDEVVLNDYDTNLLNLSKVDGKQYGLPINWSTSIGIANNDLLKEVYGDLTSNKINEFNNFETLISEANNVLSKSYEKLALGIDTFSFVMRDYTINNNITLPIENNPENQELIHDLIVDFNSLIGDGVYLTNFESENFTSEFYSSSTMPLEVVVSSGLMYSLKDDIDTSYYIPSFGDKKVIQSIQASYIKNKDVKKDFSNVDEVAKLIFENILTSNKAINEFNNGLYLPPKISMMNDNTIFSQSCNPLLLPAFEFILNSNVLENCCYLNTTIVNEQIDALLDALIYARFNNEFENADQVYFNNLNL